MGPSFILSIYSLFVLTVLFTYSEANGIDHCPRQRNKFEHMIPFRDQCLQLMTGNASKQWVYAHQDCLLQGGDLLEITDAEMQKFIMSKLHDISRFDIWLGVSDHVVEGKWVWVSGAPSEGHYSNWYPGEGPAQHNFLLADFMDCGLLNYNDKGYWYNYPCASPAGFDFNYICQYGTGIANSTSVSN